MIVPMDKVSLVVMDKEKESALDKLRDLGVLHLERRQVQSDTLSKLVEKKNRADAALSMMLPVEEAQAKKKKKNRGGDAKPIPEDPIGAVLAVAEEKKSLQDELTSLLREKTRIEKWGDFDPKGFAALAEKGVNLTPYELTQAAYEKAGNDVKLIVLSKDKTGVRAVSVGGEIPGETPFVLPEQSLSSLEKRVEGIKKEMGGIDGKFAELLPALPKIKEEQAKLLEKVEYETAKAGMEILEEKPEDNENFEGRTVSWLSGYIPKDRLGVLKRGASENGWALIADDPGPEDNVPTLLKNNKFVELINPLTGFLEVVPGYHEVDISLWFLIFFTIFFGMIFGDAGYGAILLISGIVGIFATLRKGVPPVVKLLCLLGFSNFVWGVLTCSWFGVDVELVPGVLKRISLPLISNVTSAQSDHDAKIVQQNLMIFCFSLALLQLSIGHILAIFHDRSPRIIANIGNIMMLFGMYCIILFLIASNEARQIPLFQPAVYIFAGGFLLNFIFASYDGSVGRSILESFKNIISVVLGIANVFSDIMSYIRLWAVGLAGAAIAGTVNSMAGPMLGHLILFVFGVILLVFGHGLNLILNALSVLVHAVRLNTLEFSGHVGLTWAGNAYKPFAKRTK